MVLQQIGAALLGQPLGLFAPPRGNLLVIAGEQHFGDCAAFPLARPCVMRIFQQSRGEALLVERVLIAGHTRQEPHASVDQDLGCNLAAGQNVIAN